jgi:hypothetical protein
MAYVVTTIEEFDSAIEAFEVSIVEDYKEFEVFLAEYKRDYGTTLNRNFEWPEYDLVSARKFCELALNSPKGEYREYLLDRMEEALICGANSCHTAGPRIIVK